jgi:hypothetical protein
MGGRSSLLLIGRTNISCRVQDLVLGKAVLSDELLKINALPRINFYQADFDPTAERNCRLRRHVSAGGFTRMVE